MGIKASGVPRKDIWITSKLFELHHRPEHVEMACRDTLEKLGTDYLDMYLMHYPVSSTFQSTGSSLISGRMADAFPRRSTSTKRTYAHRRWKTEDRHSAFKGFRDYIPSYGEGTWRFTGSLTYIGSLWTRVWSNASGYRTSTSTD